MGRRTACTLRTGYVSATGAHNGESEATHGMLGELHHTTLFPLTDKPHPPLHTHPTHNSTVERINVQQQRSGRRQGPGLGPALERGP
jgi:hypothetical protein